MSFATNTFKKTWKKVFTSFPHSTERNIKGGRSGSNKLSMFKCSIQFTWPVLPKPWHPVLICISSLHFPLLLMFLGAITLLIGRRSETQMIMIKFIQTFLHSYFLISDIFLSFLIENRFFFSHTINSNKSFLLVPPHCTSSPESLLLHFLLRNEQASRWWQSVRTKLDTIRQGRSPAIEAE